MYALLPCRAFGLSLPHSSRLGVVSPVYPVELAATFFRLSLAAFRMRSHLLAVTLAAYLRLIPLPPSPSFLFIVRSGTGKLAETDLHIVLHVLCQVYMTVVKSVTYRTTDTYSHLETG